MNLAHAYLLGIDGEGPGHSPQNLDKIFLWRLAGKINYCKIIYMKEHYYDVKIELAFQNWILKA